LGFFVYFTNLDLVFCFVFFLISLFADGGRLLSFFNGFVLISVSLTMAVYHFFIVPNLRKTNSDYKIYSFPDIVVHYLVPSLVIAHWLVFADKGRFELYYPLIWPAALLIYFVALLVRAKFGAVLEHVGSKYPYYFIDLEKLGAKAVMRNVVAISAAIVAFGYVLLFIDRILG